MSAGDKVCSPKFQDCSSTVHLPHFPQNCKLCYIAVSAAKAASSVSAPSSPPLCVSSMSSIAPLGLLSPSVKKLSLMYCRSSWIPTLPSQSSPQEQEPTVISLSCECWLFLSFLPVSCKIKVKPAIRNHVLGKINQELQKYFLFLSQEE